MSNTKNMGEIIIENFISEALNAVKEGRQIFASLSVSNESGVETAGGGITSVISDIIVKGKDIAVEFTDGFQYHFNVDFFEKIFYDVEEDRYVFTIRQTKMVFNFC